MPVVFRLLPRKKEETYLELFQAINAVCQDLDIPIPDPETIIIDFEHGVKNVIRQEYPNSKMQGRFFHLHQSMQRALRENKLLQY